MTTTRTRSLAAVILAAGNGKRLKSARPKLGRSSLHQQRRPDLQVSLTVTGDAVCKATNLTYRLDTPEAREFLSEFITLPPRIE